MSNIQPLPSGKSEDQKKSKPSPAKPETRSETKPAFSMTEVKAKLIVCKQHKDEGAGKVGINTAQWYHDKVLPAKQAIDADGESALRHPAVADLIALEIPTIPEQPGVIIQPNR